MDDVFARIQVFAQLLDNFESRGGCGDLIADVEANAILVAIQGFALRRRDCKRTLVLVIMISASIQVFDMSPRVRLYRLCLQDRCFHELEHTELRNYCKDYFTKTSKYFENTSRKKMKLFSRDVQIESIPQGLLGSALIENIENFALWRFVADAQHRGIAV